MIAPDIVAFLDWFAAHVESGAIDPLDDGHVLDNLEDLVATGRDKGAQ